MFQIFKWQNRPKRAFSELTKYEEIANFLGGMDFIWPMN